MSTRNQQGSLVTVTCGELIDLLNVNISQSERSLRVVGKLLGAFQRDQKTSVVFLVLHGPILITFSLFDTHRHTL